MLKNVIFLKFQMGVRQKIGWNLAEKVQGLKTTVPSKFFISSNPKN